jgi:hypothetical protein
MNGQSIGTCGILDEQNMQRANGCYTVYKGVQNGCITSRIDHKQETPAT